MATKLKNTTRHWLFKGLAWLVIMLLGVNIIWATYQRYEASDINLSPNYGSSIAYYNNLDRYYQQVYDAYLPDPEHPDTRLLGELNAQTGYYYLVSKADTHFYSNIENLSSEEDFYSSVYAFHQIYDESSQESQGGKTYFAMAPPKEISILIGEDHNQFQKESEAYTLNWYEENKDWFIFLGASLGGILLSMIYLALVSGRKPDSDEIHFNELDRIFSDVYLVLWITLEAFMLQIISEIDLIRSDLGFAVTAMVFCVISGSIGLAYWMLIAKRIKSRTLFKHTLVACIFRNTVGRLFGLFKTLFDRIKNSPLPLWSILMAGIFMVINLLSLLFAIIFTSAFGPFGLLMGIFCYGTGIALMAMYLIYQDQQVERAVKCIEEIQKGNMTPSEPLGTTKQFARLFKSITCLANSFKTAVEKEVKAERMKSELITNVSHDIRTPLTSIITYVDLLKTKGLSDPEAPEFVNILDQKSQRLKQLTDDLFEASKASSGSLQVNPEHIKLQDFMLQAIGEFEERFGKANLEIRTDFGTEITWLWGDGRHLWRTFENLFLNICKYAVPHSRVYLSSEVQAGNAVTITLKNISADPLNMPAESFLERFTRGDISRNTEGSGLGISIAKSLTELMGGQFRLETDGDLFKVMVTLPTGDERNN